MPDGDHFSKQARHYAKHRPTYPAALFEHLAALAPSRVRAWDCGTGSGQAAVGLAAHFDEVIASDVSPKQLERAVLHERVVYCSGRAEELDLEPGSVDLVVVAQAVHWFALDAFYAHVRRVAKPGAVVAVWCYHLGETTPAVDAVVERLYRNVLEPYWPREVALVEAGYGALPFPFVEIPTPAFRAEADWSLDDLTGYLRSWSAVQRCLDATGRDPVAETETALAEAWGPAPRLHVSWPLDLRVGRVSAPG